MMKIRDRIKELRRVKASELYANPKNWRTHPKAQQEALRGVLTEIGYAGALVARELPNGDLELIDGHLRAETTPDEMVPVLVLDVNEDEAAKLLAIFDPMAAMAETNKEALGQLMLEIDTESEAVQAMLDGLASQEGIDLGDPLNPASEWGGMPDYENEDKRSFQSIHVHFKNQEDVDAFAKVVQQTITDKTRSIYFPEAEIETYADKRYADES